MAENNKIKSGTIILQEKKFLRSHLQDKFCVLYGKSSDRHPHLDLYESRDAFDTCLSKGKRCDKQIDLQGMKYIKQSTQTGSKGGMEYRIELKCRSGRYTLMFEKEREKNDWFVALNSTVDIPMGHDEDSSTQQPLDEDAGSDDDEIVTVNQMYQSSGNATRFEVDIQPTPLATLCGIVGRKTLLVSGTDMAFEDPTSKYITSTFQMAWLRRFGVKNGMFTFEVGRKCPNGEGSIHCKSTSYKLIHDMLTDASSSKGKTVTKSNVLPSSISKKATQKQSGLQSGIGEPTLLKNGKRSHPGQGKIATLIPLPNEQDIQRSGHTPPTPKRGTQPEIVPRLSTRDQESDQRQRNEISRSVSEKHENNFAKELEEKLLHPNNEEVENKSIDSKNEKKEKEKDRKSKKKEEQKAKAKEESSKKKKNKKDKDHNKGSGKEANVKPAVDLYEEVDTINTPPGSPTMTTTEPLYDEAVTATSKTPPKIKAKPPSIKTKAASANNASDGQYDTNSVKHSVEPVEYAQPYTKGKGVPVQVDPVMYADVKDVKANAWENYGRKEDEEFHEEDYSNIKNVRKELEKNPGPPPIPQKNYLEDDETYDNLNVQNVNHVQTDSANIYGTASAHSVGPLPVGVPDRRSAGSESGESYSGAGVDVGDDAQYEGYEDPKVVAARSQAVSQNVAKPKFSLKSPKPPEDSLYDEVA